MTREAVKDFRYQALQILKDSLESAHTQHPLDTTQVFNYQRPNLGGTVPIELYRAVRLLAFREAFGSRIAAAVLKASGRSIGRKLNISTIPEMIQTLEGFALGKVGIAEESVDRIVLTSTECATCSGLPNIGETFCHFEAGLIAGGLESVLGKPLDAVETRCWGLGDQFCSWEVTASDQSGIDSIEPIELVMSLAEQAASAMENAHAIRQSNRELRAAYKQLRQSEQLTKDLTGMVVHDLRVPLTAVVGSIQTLSDLLEPESDSQVSEVIRIALSSSETMMRMIDDLLDVSRIEEGKIALHRQELSIYSIIDEAVSQLEIAIRNRRLKIIKGIQPDVPSITADRDRILRVMLNLLSNAVRHTPAKGQITLTAKYLADEKLVKISVSDTGEGIPKSHQKKIFDKFVQIDTPGTKKKSSSGLGLTFCKLMTEAHGGSIWVESEPGLGSTFNFTLPA